MYQASKKFGDAIAGSNRKFNTRLLENEKVLVESVKNFTITSGAEEITIGSAVASYVQATIENKGIALSGKEVSLEIGVEVDGAMEYIPMGLYTIQNPKIESNKVTFTAYDRLASRCNGAYYSKLSYPTDAVDILAEISTMTGVAIDISTLQRGIQINQRAIIEEGDYNEETDESEVITTYVNPFDGYTYKETIGFIAGLFGKFAICGRTGMIEFRWYQDISYEIPSNIFYNDLQETEESFSIKRLTCDNSDQTLSSGSGATGISMQNPVMTQSILDGVYNTVQGLVFTPAALRFIGDTRLDIGDIVTAVKNDGTKFTIPIISLITSYDGGLMQTIASYGNTAEEDDSDTKGPITEMAERVEYELAFVKKLMVDNLTATNATIKNLSGDVLKFKTGEFETLKTDVANFKQTFTDDLQASNAKINTLESDHATFKEATATNLNATNARIANIEADYLKATDAKLTYATITNLNTTNAEITRLKTKDAEIDKLVATKATITDLNAAVGRVGLLESSYANLNTLVNGNLTSDNIQNLTLTSKNTTIENGMIKNAMIENLSFDKITGMDINTTNLTVHSSDGKSKWSDNTIQISDANRVRVQIGKDASNDYSMSVWDKNGNLIWDALGATEKTIQRKIIRDGIVADDANISGSKLDINSVIKEVNGSTTKLKSSTIVMNDKNQTLDVVFNEMETTVADNLSSAKLYADGKLSDAQKYALEQANSALSSAKSYADSAVDNIEVGGRNLILNSAFKKSRKEWTDWGNPTTREIVSSNGKMWAHIVGNKQNYQGFNQWTPAGSIKEGDHITFSARIKGSAANQKFSVGIHWLNSSNIIINQDWHIFTVDTTENIYTWTVDAKGSGCDKLNLMVGVSDTSAAYNVYFTEIMVVKGNKSSDWTPAPEDTQSQIDNITEITTSHTTSISTMQGQISSLISEDTTIKGSYDALLSRYNATVATVDSIKTTIGEHTTILNNQNDSIIAVTTKANTIESNLAGTTQTISEVKSGLTGTQERVTKVETSLSGLITRVSSTETNLANLEIGGRNLVLRSKDFTSGDDYWYINGNYRKSIDDDGFTVVSISRSGAGLEWNRIIPHAFIPVEEMHRGIIVSFDFMCDKVSELDRGCICALQTYNSGGGRIGWYESQDILSGTQCKLSAPLSDGKWIRVQVPFSEGDLKKTYGSSDAVAYTSVSLQLVSNGSIHFKKVKIEYGNKATDYTEAPEDVDQQITAAETIASQTADKFNWLVKSGTNSTNFELTDRTATLVASAINMNGLVTFSGLNTDAKNEIGKVAQSKVDGLEVGGRNLALNTSNSYSIAYTSFNGSENTCFGDCKVTCKGIAIGDVVTAHLYIKYTDIVPVSGQTARIWLQGSGNFTAWNDGDFAPSEHKAISGNGEFEFLYSFTMSSNMYINTYWTCALRTDYIKSGSIQYKAFKVEKGNKATDWTPAPEDYLPQASLVSNWTTNTTWIDGGKIYTGSITADKIDVNSIFAKDITATGTITGANLIGATGTFSGQITATEGTIGRYDITSTYLMTNSGSNASGIGGNQAFWAGAEDSNSAPFRVGYDGSFVAENATIYGNIKTGNIGDAGDTAWLVDGHLSVQGTANDTNIYSTWFKFGIGGDYYLKSVSDGVKCYHTMYATDFVADGWVYCSEVHSSGAVVIGADSESFYWAHGYQIGRGTSWGGVCLGDDSQQLRLYGSSIWASHSISTSDENLKENFTTLDQYENFYMNLNPIGFNYIGDYDGKKTHFGFGAHKTEDILESEGYDSDKFAVVTHRPLVQEDIEKRFGKDVEVDIETEYGISYTEFIALNTHMIQKTRKDLIYQAGQIDMQEAIINDLQTRLLQAEKTIKQLTQALA
ncbi:MAG: tail fiber domain-containing protein [Anaerostipes hadrus]